MTDPNLPAGLPSDFNDETEPKMKICPNCGGLGADSKDGIDIIPCGKCNSTGEVEMTFDEIRDEIEAKKEKI